MAKASEKGGFGLGTAIEVVMVIINSTKNKEPGADGKGGGLALDKNKLAWGLSGIAGQQVIKGFARRRERKELAREYAAGLISEADFKAGRRSKQVKRKKNRFGVGMLAGMAVGGTAYILAMPPEQRARLFKQLDQTATQIIGLVGELQGKPYSDDYEPKAGSN
jgi:hypothetical protein